MIRFLKKSGNTKEYFYLFGIFPGNPGEDKRVIITDRGLFVESGYYDDYYYKHLEQYIKNFIEDGENKNINIQDYPIFEAITTTINPKSKLADINSLDPTITKSSGIIPNPKFLDDTNEDPYLNDYLDYVELTEGEYLVGLKNLI